MKKFFCVLHLTFFHIFLPSTEIISLELGFLQTSLITTWPDKSRTIQLGRNFWKTNDSRHSKMYQRPISAVKWRRRKVKRHKKDVKKWERKEHAREIKFHLIYVLDFVYFFFFSYSSNNSSSSIISWKNTPVSVVF